MSIAILGGSGFIGTRLASALQAAGEPLRILDRHPSPGFAASSRTLDLRDAAATQAALAGSTTVVDLAASAHERLPPDDYQYEADSAARLASVTAAADAAGVRRVLLLGSVSVYGPDQPGADETARLDPRTPYARSKLAAEQAWSRWQAQAPAQRRLVRLRACVVFGEGHRGNVQRLISALRRGRFLMVGDGSNHKSIAYVGNLIAAIRHLLDGPAGDLCFNYADPPAPSTAELLAEIRAQLPLRPLPPRIPPALALAGAGLLDAATRLGGRGGVQTSRLRSFLADTRIDCTRLDATGFRRPFTWQDGLRRTLAADQ